MAWWEKLFEPMPTGNLAGDTIGAINGSPVAAARAPSGSFDPNKVVAAMPEAYREGFAPAAEFLAAVSNQRQQAAEQAMKMPESTWLQGIGRALSAASVPVAYAQGNLGYGGKMAGNTEQDIYNRRRDAYDDQATRSRVAGNDAFYGSLGTAGLDYISKRRDTERAFKLQATKIMSAARRTGDPRIITEAEAMVRGLAEAQGVGGGAAAPAASAVTPSSATGGAAATSVPGTVMTPPSAAPAAGAAPGPQQSTMEIGTPSVVPSPTAGSPEALARFKRNQAAVALAAGDEDAAKALIEEAKILEEPGQKGKIKYSEKRAESEAENTTKAQMAQTLRAQVDQYIGEAERVLDKPGINQYIGPIQGGPVGRYVIDNVVGFLPGNQSGPADRAELQAIQNNLVQALKPFLRVPGEGSQDQREFQSIIDSVGDLTSMPTAADAQQTLNSLKRRISVMLSKYGSPDQVPQLTERLSVTDKKGNTTQVTAPTSAEPASKASLGATRIVNGTTYVKTKDGWVEKPRDPAANWSEAY